MYNSWEILYCIISGISVIFPNDCDNYSNVWKYAFSTNNKYYFFVFRWFTFTNVTNSIINVYVENNWFVFKNEVRNQMLLHSLMSLSNWKLKLHFVPFYFNDPYLQTTVSSSIQSSSGDYQSCWGILCFSHRSYNIYCEFLIEWERNIPFKRTKALYRFTEISQFQRPY